MFQAVLSHMGGIGVSVKGGNHGVVQQSSCKGGPGVCTKKGNCKIAVAKVANVGKEDPDV